MFEELNKCVTKIKVHKEKFWKIQQGVTKIKLV